MHQHSLLMHAANIPSVGRSVTNGQNGNNSSYSLALSPAPVAGTQLWLVGASNTGTFTPSGGTGSAWTRYDSPTGYIYGKLCNGTEPTSYSITYSGSAKADASIAAIVEILNANATNPDDHQVNTGSDTPPSATSSSLNDLAVLGWIGGTILPTAPAGYTIQTSGTKTSYGATIATKTSAGSGSISPGAFSVAASYISTALFKP